MGTSLQKQREWNMAAPPSVESVMDSVDVSDEPTGIYGSLREMPLPEIVQFLGNGRKDALVELRIKDGARGSVAVVAGKVVFACTAAAAGSNVGNLSGEPAFFALMRGTRGAFRIHFGHSPSRRNIDRDTAFLLLESARLDDELARDASGPNAPAPSNVLAFEPRVIVSPELCSTDAGAHDPDEPVFDLTPSAHDQEPVVEAHGLEAHSSPAPSTSADDEPVRSTSRRSSRATGSRVASSSMTRSFRGFFDEAGVAPPVAASVADLPRATLVGMDDDEESMITLRSRPRMRSRSQLADPC
jgi:hypothetical protein